MKGDSVRGSFVARSGLVTADATGCDVTIVLGRLGVVSHAFFHGKRFDVIFCQCFSYDDLQPLLGDLTLFKVALHAFLFMMQFAYFVP